MAVPKPSIEELLAKAYACYEACDRKGARKWYQKAADMGSREAMNWLLCEQDPHLLGLV